MLKFNDPLWIDRRDKSDLSHTKHVCKILMLLSLGRAAEVYEDIDERIAEDFCYSCDQVHERCYCHYNGELDEGWYDENTEKEIKGEDQAK